MILDPRNYYLPFYIGKGSGRRAHAHLTETRVLNENRTKASIIKRIRDDGYEPKVFFWKTDIHDEKEACRLASHLISTFGRRGAGGLLANARPKPPINYGPMSELTKSKISLATKGKCKPAGFGEMIAERNRGRVVSDATKLKMKNAHAKRKAEGLVARPRRKLSEDEKKAISDRVTEQWKSVDRKIKQQLAFENRRNPNY